MAQLKRAQYGVLIDDGTDHGVEHVVTVIHGDMIRGEATARSRKVPALADAQLEHASIWVWHAMKRAGRTDQPYGEWIETVIDVQPVTDSTGAAQLVDVDPTTAPSDLR